MGRRSGRNQADYRAVLAAVKSAGLTSENRDDRPGTHRDD